MNVKELRIQNSFNSILSFGFNLGHLKTYTSTSDGVNFVKDYPKDSYKACHVFPMLLCIVIKPLHQIIQWEALDHAFYSSKKLSFVLWIPSMTNHIPNILLGFI